MRGSHLPRSNVRLDANNNKRTNQKRAQVRWSHFVYMYLINGFCSISILNLKADVLQTTINNDQYNADDFARRVLYDDDV